MNELATLAEMLGTKSSVSKSLYFEYVYGTAIASLVQMELHDCGDLTLVYLKQDKHGNLIKDHSIEFPIEDDWKQGNIRRLMVDYLKGIGDYIDSTRFCYECDDYVNESLRIINHQNKEVTYTPFEAMKPTYSLAPL